MSSSPSYNSDATSTDNSNVAVVDVDRDPENQKPMQEQPNIHDGSTASKPRFHGHVNKKNIKEAEELCHSYDMNGNGKIDLAAAMDIAHNARAKERKVQETRTWAILATATAILFALATFGLVWVVLILSKGVETDGNNYLVSTNDHSIVKTYNHGCLNHFEFIHELIQDQADGSLELEADDEGLALLGQVPMAEVEQSYAAISQDFHVCTVMWTFEGVEYARKIDPTDIARQVDPTTGNIKYHGIIVSDSIIGDVNAVLQCFPEEQSCHVYRRLPEGQRKLHPCFSPNSSVMTESKGAINIMDLEVNDRVQTSDGSFSTVYAFSHRTREHNATALRIETETATIELTGNHMIYLANKDLPVLARSVVVGDKLVRISDDLNSSKAESVLKITEVDIKGFIAPLTVSGDIVVDSILASSYTEIAGSGSEYYYFHGEDSMLNMHTHVLAHVSLTPLRLACTWVSSSLCAEEYHYTELHHQHAGSHFYATALFHLVQFALSEQCGIILHAVLFITIVGSFLLLFVLENFLPTILLYGGMLSFTLGSLNKIREDFGLVTCKKLKEA